MQKSLGLVLGLLAPVILHAESAETRLPDITVTADPFAGRSPVESTHPSEVLSREALERALDDTLGNTLTTLPGVQASDFGAGASRPVIRGQGGPRVRILDSGTGVLDASTISPDHAVAVESSRARQIEILKGPATLLYGSGAIGGVVNVASDLIPEELNALHGGLLLGMGEVDDSRKISGHAGSSIGNWAWHLDGLRQRSEDYAIPGVAHLEDANEPDAPRGTLENSFTRTSSFGAGASYIREDGHSGFGLSRFNTVYGVAGHAHEDEHGGGGKAADEHAGEDVRIDLEQERYEWRGERHSADGRFERMRGSLVHSRYQHAELEPDETSGGFTPGTVFRNRSTEARLELTRRASAEQRGVFGLHGVTQAFSADGEEAFVPTVDTHSLGLFWLEEREIAAQRFSLGGRYEHFRHLARDNDDKRFDLLSLSAGWHMELEAHQHLTANFSHAQRAPDVQEMYSQGPHLATTSYELGSLDLHREKANNLDLGWKLDHPDLQVGIDLFYTRYEDYIYSSEVDADNDGNADRVSDEYDPATGQDPGADKDLILLQFEQTDARYYGGELSLRRPFSSHHAVRVFADWVRAERSGGQALPRIPPARYGIQFEGAFARLSYALGLTQVRAQTKITALETPTAGFQLLSLDLAYQIPASYGDYRLALRGRNLLDEDVRNHVSFLKDQAPAPGRDWRLELRLDF